MKRKIYISGPMTGLPDLNRKSFNNAYKELIHEPNTKVINPVTIGDALFVPGFLPGKLKWFIYMFFDVLALLFCNEIYMLEGWEKSSGAMVELKIAKFLLMTVTYEDLGKPYLRICLKCGVEYESCYSNHPDCPACGEKTDIWWVLKDNHTHLVPEPEECKVEILKVKS